MAATIYEPLSTAHLKPCTVDFDSRPGKKAVNLVQYDQTIPVLCVSLKKGGTEYKVPSDADVNIRMDKRDGYHVYNPALGVNAERTIAYFAVTPQMSTGWGEYYPIVEINVGGGIAGSAPLWLHFDKNPVPDSAIQSSDEYKTLAQIVADAAASAAAAAKSAEDAATSEGNAAASAKKAQTLVDGMQSDYSQAMKDIGTLKNQMQRAYPDDSTIGENPWSSKNIVDMLCPPLEESGNPVVCYPVAGYPLGVKVSWEPVQEGSGTPSPDNIRPIKGRDAVKVRAGGKNLWEFGDQTVTQGKNLEFKAPLMPGRYVISGVTTSTDTDNYENTVEVGNIYITFNRYTRRAYKFTLRKSATRLSLYSARSNENAKGDVSTWTEMMIEYGDTETAYEPYIGGNTYTATLPETVYGGEVDAVTGAGKRTWGIIDNYAGEAIPREWISDRDVYRADKNPTVGAQVAYRLAEPVPFTATGAQPIPALAGVNTVLTDADSATVTGRADPIKRITDLEDAVASQT